MREPAPVVHEHVRVGDDDVMVHRAGQGNEQTVLFLHGSGVGATGWSNWQLALPALGHEYDCLAPDYCGFGETTHPSDPPSDARIWTRRRIDQLVGLLDALAVSRAHIVGNSLGGALALQLLVENPDRFGRAVLMGTGGVQLGPPSVEFLHMLSFYRDPSPKAAARDFSYYVYDAASLGDRMKIIAQARLEMASRPEIRRSYDAMTKAGGFPPVAESSIRRIPHPVLLVHGKDDAIIPLSDSLQYLDLLPDARLHVFGQCGHWTQIEQPERFNHLIAAFLRDEL